MADYDTPRRDEEPSQGVDPQTNRRRGNAANLSREARVKGGRHSAQVQVRDQRGKFAGRSKDEGQSRRDRTQEENPANQPSNEHSQQ